MLPQLIVQIRQELFTLFSRAFVETSIQASVTLSSPSRRSIRLQGTLCLPSWAEIQGCCAYCSSASSCFHNLTVFLLSTSHSPRCGLNVFQVFFDAQIIYISALDQLPAFCHEGPPASGQRVGGGTPNWNSREWEAQNFAFFPSPSTICILSSFSRWSSRGILVVFDAAGPSNVHVWSSWGLWCEAPAQKPRGFTQQLVRERAVRGNKRKKKKGEKKKKKKKSKKEKGGGKEKQKEEQNTSVYTHEQLQLQIIIIIAIIIIIVIKIMVMIMMGKEEEDLCQPHRLPKRAHLRAPALPNTKIPREDSQREKRNEHGSGRGKTREQNFGRSGAWRSGVLWSGGFKPTTTTPLRTPTTTTTTTQHNTKMDRPKSAMTVRLSVFVLGAEPNRLAGGGWKSLLTGFVCMRSQLASTQQWCRLCTGTVLFREGLLARKGKLWRWRGSPELAVRVVEPGWSFSVQRWACDGPQRQHNSFRLWREGGPCCCSGRALLCSSITVSVPRFQQQKPKTPKP